MRVTRRKLTPRIGDLRKSVSTFFMSSSSDESSFSSFKSPVGLLSKDITLGYRKVKVKSTERLQKDRLKKAE
jgi:hypothetical protein